ncbi:MAG: hypothetical protein DRG20_05280 [Deltaproteobacteria bacterium]|nr:MAG: hypothetical protein DRG20_05280 [Deltaproteobacteria bacterium]
MKIFLIDPPHHLFPGLRMWAPSFGLLSIASLLNLKGYDVKICDATTFNHPWGDLIKQLKEEKPDLVGITCQSTCMSPEAIKTAEIVRELLPSSFIILGGTHATMMAKEVLKTKGKPDLIVMGEGELTFIEIAKLLTEGDRISVFEIPGIAYLKEGKFNLNHARKLIEDLDTLPMPSYHLINMDAEAYYWHGMGKRAFGISTSRGCGDRCAYCSETAFWDGHWRGRSGQAVVEEIKFLNKRYNKSLFIINENSFNWNRKRVEEFLEFLGKSGLKIDFWFQSRVKDIIRDKDLMPEFKRLGLYEVMLGIESINPKVLDHYNKRQNLEMAEEAIAILKKNRIMVMTNVMFGDEWDDENTLKAILKFVKKRGDFLVLTITTPLPGTLYYKECEAAGRIEEKDFSKYDFMHPIMPTKYLSRQEVAHLHQKALRSFYTQPKILLGAIYNRNPFKRMAYRLIMRYVWENATKRPWKQPNLESSPYYS